MTINQSTTSRAGPSVRARACIAITAILAVVLGLFTWPATAGANTSVAASCDTSTGVVTVTNHTGDSVFGDRPGLPDLGDGESGPVANDLEGQTVVFNTEEGVLVATVQIPICDVVDTIPPTDPPPTDPPPSTDPPVTTVPPTDPPPTDPPITGPAPAPASTIPVVQVTGGMVGTVEECRHGGVWFVAWTINAVQKTGGDKSFAILWRFVPDNPNAGFPTGWVDESVPLTVSTPYPAHWNEVTISGVVEARPEFSDAVWDRDPVSVTVTRPDGCEAAVSSPSSGSPDPAPVAAASNPETSGATSSVTRTGADVEKVTGFHPAIIFFVLAGILFLGFLFFNPISKMLVRRRTDEATTAG